MSDSASQSPSGQAQGEESGDYKHGDVINGRYIVHRLIGRGGMGAVYKVHDNVLEELLALKVLLPEFVADKVVVERFVNEVRISRKIAHPNIVRVHDIGSADNTMFISMEYVDGDSLRAILDRRGEGTRMSVRQCLYIATQLCIALKYAHRYMVHRDIKPDNIMVTRKNHIKLMDFGISKLKDNRFESNAGAIVGTPYYMAPEQVHNAPDVDGRADIYSIGVVLHELLTGKLPGGMSRSLSQQFDDIPPELDAIVARCLEPDREKRYQNPGDLRDALRGVVESLVESSSPNINSSHYSASDAASPPSLTPSNLASAMEAFLRDEGAVTTAAPGVRGPAEGAGADTFKDQAVLPEYLDFDAAPKRSAHTVKPYAGDDSFLRRYGVAIIVVVLVLGIFLSYLFGNHLRKMSESITGVTVEAAPPDVTEQVNKLVAAADLFKVLQDVVNAYRQNKTPEGLQLLEAVRDRIVADIEARAYARPFDLKKLNSASTDAVRAEQIDASPRIQELARVMTEESALFKFVLTNFDSAQGTAVFRLNNPYIAKETETVSVGDMLVGRFLVVSITSQAVHLEDTGPKCAGRPLIARPMEPISAE